MHRQAAAVSSGIEKVIGHRPGTAGTNPRARSPAGPSSVSTLPARVKRKNLIGRIAPLVAAPDADEEEQRHQRELEEQIEEDDVAGDKHAQHARFQHQEQAIVERLLLANRLPTHQHGDHHQQGRQAEEPEAQAVQGDAEADVQRQPAAASQGTSGRRERLRAAAGSGRPATAAPRATARPPQAQPRTARALPGTAAAASGRSIVSSRREGDRSMLSDYVIRVSRRRLAEKWTSPCIVHNHRTLPIKASSPRTMTNA